MARIQETREWQDYVHQLGEIVDHLGTEYTLRALHEVVIRCADKSDSGMRPMWESDAKEIDALAFLMNF